MRYHRNTSTPKVRNPELAKLRTRTDAGPHGKQGRRKNRAERKAARERLRREGTLD